MTPIEGYIRNDGTIRIVYQTIGGRDPGWHTLDIPAEGLDSAELAELAAEELAFNDAEERRYGGSIGGIDLVPAFPGI